MPNVIKYIQYWTDEFLNCMINATISRNCFDDWISLLSAYGYIICHSFQKFKSSIAYGIAMFGTSITLLLFLLDLNYGVFLFLSVLFGAGSGVEFTLQTTVPKEIFGRDSTAVVIGQLYLWSAIGSFIGPLWAGTYC